MKIYKWLVEYTVTHTQCIVHNTCHPHIVLYCAVRCLRVTLPALCAISLSPIRRCIYTCLLFFLAVAWFQLVGNFGFLLSQDLIKNSSGHKERVYAMIHCMKRRGKHVYALKEVIVLNLRKLWLLPNANEIFEEKNRFGFFHSNTESD